mmetsp:Transcript_43056/g.138408  ORF Transcript_43056/g.138408 Transcript_43056/m.138408 type:complete len:211 (-) Transcript_43056:313-945(-)
MFVGVQPDDEGLVGDHRLVMIVTALVHVDEGVHHGGGKVRGEGAGALHVVELLDLGIQEGEDLRHDVVERLSILRLPPQGLELGPRILQLENAIHEFAPHRLVPPPIGIGLCRGVAAAAADALDHHLVPDDIHMHAIGLLKKPDRAGPLLSHATREVVRGVGQMGLPEAHHRGVLLNHLPHARRERVGGADAARGNAGGCDHGARRGVSH